VLVSKIDVALGRIIKINTLVLEKDVLLGEGRIDFNVIHARGEI